MVNGRSGGTCFDGFSSGEKKRGFGNLAIALFSLTLWDPSGGRGHADRWASLKQGGMAPEGLFPNVRLGDKRGREAYSRGEEGRGFRRLQKRAIYEK